MAQINSIASRLFNSARSLKRKGAWVQGVYSDMDTGAVCAIGEVRARTGVKAVPFLFAALPKSYQGGTFMQGAIITYNDRKNRRKREIVRLFQRAGSLAMKTKGNAKLLKGNAKLPPNV